MSETIMVIGGTYRHYKGPLYRILGLVRYSETGEEMVYYECLYENPNGQFWVRPKAMFLDSVTVEGQLKPRFELMDSHECVPPAAHVAHG